MTFTCSACKRSLDIDATLRDGDIITCPYCGEETTYRRPARIGIPERKTTPASEVRSDAPSSPATKPKLCVRRPAPLPPRPASVLPEGTPPPKPPRQPPPRESNNSNSGSSSWVFGLLAVVILVLGGYWWYASRSSGDSSESPDERPAPRTQRPTDKAEHSRDDARKAEQAKRDLEKRRRDEERRAREEERAQKLKALKDKSAAEKIARERVADVEQKFRMAPLLFASDFPKSNPLSSVTNGTFYAADASYPVNREILQLVFKNTRLSSALRFSRQKGQEPLSPDKLSDTLTAKRLILLDETGLAWFYGTGKPAWNEDVSLDANICPMKSELQELKTVFSALAMKSPPLKYRITLKAKTGKDGLPLGIINFTDSLSCDKIKAAFVERIKQARSKQVDALAKPKLKRFKPTHIFYDGERCIGGLDVTKVPRAFKYFGTAHNGVYDQRSVNRARQQWETLAAKAREQEERKAAIERDNEEKIRAFESRVKAIVSAPIPAEELDAIAKDFTVFIERSRSKRPSGTDSP